MIDSYFNQHWSQNQYEEEQTCTARVTTTQWKPSQIGFDDFFEEDGEPEERSALHTNWQAIYECMQQFPRIGSHSEKNSWHTSKADKTKAHWAEQ